MAARKRLVKNCYKMEIGRNEMRCEFAGEHTEKEMGFLLLFGNKKEEKETICFCSIVWFLGGTHNVAENKYNPHCYCHCARGKFLLEPKLDGLF